MIYALNWIEFWVSLQFALRFNFRINKLKWTELKYVCPYIHVYVCMYCWNALTCSKSLAMVQREWMGNLRNDLNWTWRVRLGWVPSPYLINLILEAMMSFALKSTESRSWQMKYTADHSAHNAHFCWFSERINVFAMYSVILKSQSLAFSGETDPCGRHQYRSTFPMSVYLACRYDRIWQVYNPVAWTLLASFTMKQKQRMEGGEITSEFEYSRPPLIPVLYSVS